MQTTSERRRPLNQDPDAVRKKRLAKGLGQIALARKASITPAFVSKIETGKSSVNAEVLVRLAVALECTVEELLA